MTRHPAYQVHFWRNDLGEPPCGTLEDRFAWSDEFEDVTCDACRQALAGDSGGLGDTRRSAEDERAPL